MRGVPENPSPASAWLTPTSPGDSPIPIDTLFENWRQAPQDLQLLSRWINEVREQAQQRPALGQLAPCIEQADPATAAGIHAALIHLHLDLGELVRAHELVESLQALEPDGYRPPYFMGLILKRLGRLEQARDAFLTAVKREQHNHNAWWELVECCALSRDFARGLVCLQRASRLPWPAQSRRFWSYKRGTLYQQMHNYALALVSYTEVVLDCLLRGVEQRPPPPAALSRVPPSAPLAALGDAVDLLEARGLQPFPVAGTLLGWWREGRFLAHDKDIDIMLPAGTDWEQVLALVTQAPGFRLLPSEMGYSNFISLRHLASGLVVDISHHEAAAEGQVKCVWRIPGVPEAQCRQTRQSAYRLVRDRWLGREFWRPEDPDQYLTEMYGDWRTPLANFDTVLSGHHVVGFPDVVRCYAYNRLANALMEGRLDRGLDYVAQILQKDPLDPLASCVRNLMAARPSGAWAATLRARSATMPPPNTG